MLEYGSRFHQIQILADEHQTAVSRAISALPGQRDFKDASSSKTDVYKVDSAVDALYLGATDYRPRYPTVPIERASEWSMKHGITLDRIVRSGDEGFLMYPHFSLVREEPRASARVLNLSAGYVVRLFQALYSFGRPFFVFL